MRGRAVDPGKRRVGAKGQTIGGDEPLTTEGSLKWKSAEEMTDAGGDQLCKSRDTEW